MVQKIIRILALAFLAQIALSYPLWYSGEIIFPRVSVWGTYSMQTPIWIPLFSTLLIIGLVSLLFFPLKKWPYYVVFCTLGILVASDLNALQVWVWFYFLALLVLFPENTDTPSGIQFDALRFLLCAVYFWSGINKITPYFAEDSFSWFCGPFPFLSSIKDQPIYGYAVAVFEFLLAPGLLWHKTRRYFLWLAVIFHLLIVLALSPLGHAWNYVVIPWNMAMMAMVYWLFGETGTEKSVFFTSNYSDIIFSLNLNYLKKYILPLILAWIAPFWGFFGLWPADLCWKMYSGTNSELTFYFPSDMDVSHLKLPQNQVFGEGEQHLTLNDWSNSRLKVPPFESEWVFSRVRKCFCESMKGKEGVGTYLLRVDPWDKGKEILEKRVCGEE